jgi:hypothetical protein
MMFNPNLPEPWGKPCEVCQNEEPDTYISEYSWCCDNCRWAIWETADEMEIIPEEWYQASGDLNDDNIKRLLSKLQLLIMGEQMYRDIYKSRRLGAKQVRVLEMMAIAGRYTAAMLRKAMPDTPSKTPDTPSKTLRRITALYHRGLIEMSLDGRTPAYTITERGRELLWERRCLKVWRSSCISSSRWA